MYNTIFIDAGDCLTYDDNWLRSKLTHPSLSLLNVTQSASHISISALRTLQKSPSRILKKCWSKYLHAVHVCVYEDNIPLMVTSGERKKKRTNIWENVGAGLFVLKFKMQNWELISPWEEGKMRGSVWKKIKNMITNVSQQSCYSFQNEILWKGRRNGLARHRELFFWGTLVSVARANPVWERNGKLINK